jgi:peptide/nickel transport system permease protein
LKRGRWQDRTIMGIALVGYSLPSFFIGLVLLFTVVFWLRLLPNPQWVDPFRDPSRFLTTMILPWITIATLNAAFYMRLTRNQVLEVFGDDYIRTARAKGLSERKVIMRHGFRNALIPLTTVVALNFGGLLGGAIITETIFSLDGMGLYFITALNDADPYPIMAWLAITSVAIVLFNLIADIAYGFLDPRVRYE